MTSQSNPAGVRRPQRPHAPAVCDRQRTPAGSTSESRLTDLLARLADADAISASRVRAWDRIQARRADQAPSPSGPQKDRRPGKGVRVCAYESRPAAGADLTSSLTIRPTERTAAGFAAHAGTGGTSGGSA